MIKWQFRMHIIDSLNLTTTTFLDKINANIKVSFQSCIVASYFTRSTVLTRACAVAGDVPPHTARDMRTYWVKMRQEDEEALEVDKDREDDRQWLVHLGRAWRCFVDLDSFHRTNIFLGLAMGIFFIIGKD